MLVLLLTKMQMITAAAAFGLILSLWLVMVVLLSMRRATHDTAVARRLGLIDDDDEGAKVLRLWRDGHEATTVVPTESVWRRRLRALRRMPEEGGLSAPWSSLVLGLIGVGALGFVVAFTSTRNVVLALAVAVAPTMVFMVYLRYRVDRNLAKFERQFVEALQLIARSLKAGHPLTAAFRLVAEEMQPPVSPIFSEIVQQQSLGVDLETALREAAAAHHSADMKLFATSVAIQLRSGGNLADLMDRLAAVIRERIRLSQRVRIVTAQTQLSKRMLLMLPVFMFLLLNVLNPQHMQPLYETRLGQYMLAGGVVAMLLGWWSMNRIATLKY